MYCIVLCCIGGKTMINVQTRMQQNAHMKRVLDREVGEIDREVMGTQMNTKSQVRSWGGVKVFWRGWGCVVFLEG